MKEGHYFYLCRSPEPLKAEKARLADKITIKLSRKGALKRVMVLIIRALWPSFLTILLSVISTIVVTVLKNII